MGTFASLAELDSLAPLQYAILADFQKGMLDGDVVRLRLIGVLGTPPMGFKRREIPKPLTLGLLNFLLSEICQRFHADYLEPEVTIKELQDTLDTARQRVADRYLEQLDKRLQQCADSHPEADRAYEILCKLVAARELGRDYQELLQQFSRVHPEWGNPNLHHLKLLARAFKEYTRKRKQIAYEVRSQLLEKGFQPGSAYMHDIEAHALLEGARYVLVFDFWDHLVHATEKQDRSNVV